MKILDEVYDRGIGAYKTNQSLCVSNGHSRRMHPHQCLKSFLKNNGQWLASIRS